MSHVSSKPSNARRAILLIAAIGLACATVHAQTTAPTPTIDDDPIRQAKALSEAFRRAAQRVTPSVVTVLAGRSRGYALSPDSRDPIDMFDDEDASVGSGVVISRRGIVLTNSHVVEGADIIIVRLNDGREYEVEQVKRDRWSDVAILVVKDPPELVAARLGDSDELQVGDWVIAIGSPFELEATVSAGIISGKGRGLRKIRRGKLLQTDAAINPGNSGGPLVNLDGEVIGINTAIASTGGGYEGIGFAIPSNRVRWVVKELLDHGAVRRSYLGVEIDDLIPRDARRRGLPQISGVLVNSVRPDSPAFVAGILQDDVILEFAGKRVEDARDLQGIVERLPVGSQQPVRLVRDGRASVLTVTLRELPPSK
jgi:serine protease Do